jgi:predicted NUDIX family NTP pyrophosphohydrolase
VAHRAFEEETSLVAKGALTELTPVRQKSGKLLYAFALEQDFDLSGFSSNTFELEWPPRSGRRQNFPEIDRIGYFELAAAKLKIIPYQLPLLSQLEKLV